MTQGSVLRERHGPHRTKGAVSLVLGAGNQGMVVALDILQRLVVEGDVVVVKMNDVNQ